MAEHRDDYILSPEEMRQWRTAIHGVMRDAGHTPRPEALRQLGSLIQLYALRTGANITAGDSTMVAHMLARLTPGEQETLASSPEAVMGKVAQIVTQFADMDVKRQEAVKQTGPQGAEQGRSDGKDRMPVILRQLPDKFRAERVSNEGKGNTSSARFADMVPGNADMRGVSMANYYTSPITRAMVDTGMNYGTFSYLRSQGFSQSNIAHAGHDARALDFDVNDKRMTKNFATIRQKGNDPEKTNRVLQSFSKGLDTSQQFRDAAQELNNANTPEQEKAARAKIKNIADALAEKHGVTKDMADQRDKAVQKAIGEIKDEKVDRKVEQIINALPAHNAVSSSNLDSSHTAQPASVFEALKKQHEASKQKAPSQPNSASQPPSSSASPKATPLAPKQ